jgi:DNA-directed RNA polymerase specialized sigma24 family protein
MTARTPADAPAPRLSKAKALNVAHRRQKALNKAEAAATEAAAYRDLAVHDAQVAGASYAEIQTATGLSTARVTQILRKARQAAAD